MTAEDAEGRVTVCASTLEAGEAKAWPLIAAYVGGRDYMVRLHRTAVTSMGGDVLWWEVDAHFAVVPPKPSADNGWVGA